MKIQVHVKPRSKVEEVSQNPDGTYTVRVRPPPADGAANIRVIELLSKHFGVPKSQIQLVSGASSRIKLFSL